MSEFAANHQRRRFLASLLVGGCAISMPSLSVHAGTSAPLSVTPSPAADEQGKFTDNAVRDAIRKAENFESNYQDDIYLAPSQFVQLTGCLNRLNRLQQFVGYANFNLISFDEARNYARNYSVIGEFSQQETDFIEYLYHFDAIKYGFLGKKVSAQLTDIIADRDVYKVSGTGHFLYRGDALRVYHRMQQQLGQQLELTSGIRSVVKQLHLFMAKAERSDGNLSRAARSLAPPGHSFHGIGDFDVGQRGLGAANFTNAFAQTEIYHRLCDMHLISMRYPFANPYGVRYEPWHIKVVKDA